MSILKDVTSYIKGNLHVNSTTNFIIFENKENKEVIISNFISLMKLQIIIHQMQLNLLKVYLKKLIL